MPNSSWFPGASSSEEDDAEALLSGRAPGWASAGSLTPAADIVAALRAPASPDELRNLDHALAAYRAHVVRHGRHRASRSRVRLVAGASIAALSLGGVAAAAVAGMLPSPIQSFAHRMVEASAPSDAALSSTHAAGSTAALASAHPAPGSADEAEAIRLCTAYQAVSGTDAVAFRHSVAFARLTALAGGAEHVDELCADVQNRPTRAGTGHTTDIPEPVDSKSEHPTAPATRPDPSHPAPRPTHPAPPTSGAPSTHPSKGGDTDHPSPPTSASRSTGKAQPTRG
jgi:hypothetical protein